MNDERFFEQELDRFWDEVVQSPRLPVAGEFDLAMEDQRLIHQFQARGAVSPPDAVRERVRRDVLSSIGIELQAKETPVNQTAILDITRPAAGPNGRTASPTRHWPRLRFPASRRRWLIAQLATAILLIVTLLGMYLILNRENRPAVQPTATPQASPLENWSQYRNGPGHAGAALGSGLKGEPIELWRVQTQGPIASEPAIVGGIMYIGSGDGHLYAFDATTGDERWAFAAGDSVDNSPAVGGGLVYTVSSDSILHAIDTESGAERWQFAPAKSLAQPVLAGDVLYVGGDDGNLYALDAATGAEHWRFATGAEVGRSPAFAGDTAYVGTESGELFAIDAATGQERWRFESGGGTAGSTVVAGDAVYEAIFNGDDNRLYALDAATGDERWTFASPSGENVWVPAVDEQTVYIPSDDGNVYALDAATGTERWRFASSGQINSTGTVVEDTLYILNQDQQLYAINSATGSLRWGFTVEGGASKGPSLVDGVLYFGTDLGITYAITGAESAAAARIPAPLIAASGATAVASPAATSGDPVEFTWETGSDIFEQPLDVVVSPDGNVWVPDMNANNIKIFNPSGALLETWGSHGSGDGQFDFADQGSVEFDSDGNFYVVDAGNHRVQKFDRDRNFVTAWGSFGTGDGQFLSASKLAVDPEGNVYVWDWKRDDVQKFASDGTFLAKITGADDAEVGPGIVIDALGYLSVPSGTRVYKLGPDGPLLWTFGGEGYGEDHWHVAIGSAVDVAGNIYVSDVVNSRVLVFDANGQFVTAWGSEGTGPGQFNEVDALALDGNGNIYVLDFGNKRVQKFRLLPPLGPEGTPTT
jgi:outer membrane protein assembly factor BamB